MRSARVWLASLGRRCCEANGLLGERQEDLVAAAEVLVERAVPDAGGLHDVGDARRVVAVLGEQASGGIEQCPAGLFAPRGAGWRSVRSVAIGAASLAEPDTGVEAAAPTHNVPARAAGQKLTVHVGSL